MKAFSYVFAFFPAVLFWFSLHAEGYGAWICVAVVFGVIPILEWFIGAKGSNLSEAQIEARSQDKRFDWVLYLLVPTQWFFLLYFTDYFSFIEPRNWEFSEWGKILGMGILCGSYGINVAHELGHRSNKWEQRLAKSLLLTSLYMHFFIEHNRGHHKHVATPEDPSSARINEPVQFFWFRSMYQTWMKSWQLEFERLKRNKQSPLHWSNQMLQFQVLQLAFLGVVYFLFGGNGLAALLLAAFIGAILLETINYIEHYGLLRKKEANGFYERVETHHSWNSNHVIGRLLLFELSRHSDHHFKSYKKYQELESAHNAPQMPTGYPGMMVLSMVFPLWFWIMNRRVAQFNS